jgi:hypothetical protein
MSTIVVAYQPYEEITVRAIPCFTKADLPLLRRQTYGW